jgi:hypothetical protein
MQTRWTCAAGEAVTLGHELHPQRPRLWRADRCEHHQEHGDHRGAGGGQREGAEAARHAEAHQQEHDGGVARIVHRRTEAHQAGAPAIPKARASESLMSTIISAPETQSSTWA